MTLNCVSSAVEPTLRYQRGAQGFLEYQEHMNSRLRTAFTPLTERAEAEFGLFLENVMQMGTLATACEISVRASEKAAKLGRKLAEEPYGGRAVELNEAALAAAQRARYFLKESLQNIDDPDNQIAKAFGSDVATERIALARREMFHELVEINIKPADFEELMLIWNETAKAAGSLESLASYLDDNIKQFIDVRVEDDRGNRPHSPLVWWKYVLIATLIGAAIFGVVACFVWFACTWFAPLLAAVAPWVFGIIDRGC